MTGIKLITPETNISKICDKLRNSKRRPDGTYELICELEREGEARSYCNDRVMWLGWKLESNGIHVKWFEC